MPRKKTVSLKKTSIEPASSLFQKKRNLLTPKNIIILVVFILALLVWRFRSYIIVATINGQPVSRMELNNQLIRQFGQQSLDNIINERLILAAARQKGIFISKEEIDDRVKQVESNLQGTASLVEALSAQGLNDNMFRRQLEIQLSIEKLFDNEATVSPEEVDEYFAQNSDLYKDATDPASLRDGIKENLKQQKVGELFQKWFSDIRENANIKKYL